MKKYDAVIAGYICVDLIPNFSSYEHYSSIESVLKPGKLLEIDGLSYTLGGVVANCGMAMKKFSKNVFLNGVIGDDFIGRIAKDYLNNYGLSTGIRIIEKESTAFGLVIAIPGIDRIFLESPGCSKTFNINQIDFDAIAQSHLFHFGYPPLLRQFYLNDGDQLVETFAAVQELGVVTALDLSLPDPESESAKIDWRKIMERTLPLTDIFVPSLEEAMQIMMPEEYSSLISTYPADELLDVIPVSTIKKIGKRIIEAGAKIVVIKSGHRGLYLWSGEISDVNKKLGLRLSEKNWNYRELWCNAYRVDEDRIKNASGAGDTASAAFFSAILDGENPETALKYAAIAGRNNLYCLDIFNELSSWPEMTREIKSATHEVTNY